MLRILVVIVGVAPDNAPTVILHKESERTAVRLAKIEHFVSLLDVIAEVSAEDAIIKI
jgi:hypothetical protein